MLHDTVEKMTAKKAVSFRTAYHVIRFERLYSASKGPFSHCRHYEPSQTGVFAVASSSTRCSVTYFDARIVQHSKRALEAVIVLRYPPSQGLG